MWKWLNRSSRGGDEDDAREQLLSEAILKVRRILEPLELPSNAARMVEAILKLEELAVRDIMTPRIDVVTVNIGSSRQELAALLENVTYSRLPVYEDQIDNIKGILHIKELFRLLHLSGGKKKLQIGKALAEPYFVPEAKKISELLNEFQLERQHLAIVVDEYGGFSGIVTFEDVLEAFLGDIQDEFDDEENEIKRVDDRHWIIDARTPVEKINALFGLELEAGEAETIGGFILMRAGSIPKLHQVIVTGQIRFKVLAKRKNSILRLRMEFKQPPPRIPSAENLAGPGKA